MVRAPCCEKMGLKKGPWTHDEDQILINYVTKHGHRNWRALPKQAGLLRCGKSCRLRWINYLRPDIKRGNFSREEEDTIIKSHEMLGNKWSAIAARLPGRTDNEIKNVWHTHLKKRVPVQKQQVNPWPETNHMKCKSELSTFDQESTRSVVEVDFTCISTTREGTGSPEWRLQPSSPPQQSSSDDVSSGDSGTCTGPYVALDSCPLIDESFWSDVLSAEDDSVASDFLSISSENRLQDCRPFSPLDNGLDQYVHGYGSNEFDDMDFWQNLLTRASEFQVPYF